MNKDTIYIEPEDDITDIITKIENSKSKIVALVPPKKAGVFRSVVNIKLVAKAAKTAEKAVVLVTADPSITRLAAASKLPVAKDLKSAPAIPTLENLDKINEESATILEKTGDLDEKDEAVIEEIEAKTELEKEKEELDDEKIEKDDKEERDDEGNEESEEDEESEGDKKLKIKKPREKKIKATGEKFGRRLIDWVKTHRVLAICCGIGLLVILIFLIWALFVAPAVDVFVSIKTDANNFSETVSFVKEPSQENIKESKLYLEERKIETVNEVTFEATGQKNVGEKAVGDVAVVSYFSNKGANAINTGTIFSISGMSFVASEGITLSWDGNNHSCENDDVIVDGKVQCRISGRVKVVAAEAGTKYNIAASSTGWETVANVAVYSDKAMSGGTDNIILTVQQSDVEKARNELANSNEEENKKKLYDSISEDSLILESTFNQNTSAAASTPAVDEEVKEGVKPTLKTTTTTSVYIVDKTKLEELIKEKINLPENKKIFDIRNIYIDGFKELEGGFTGKLKAVYFTGPKVTENEVVEKIKGKGLGDARREISDIEGVSEVKMNPSYPWVFAVPTDSNKITVSFEVKDQSGQTIEKQTDESIKSESPESEQEKQE